MPRIIDKPKETVKGKGSRQSRTGGRVLMFERVDNDGVVEATSTHFHDVFKKGTNTQVQHTWITK